jgi:spermidine synthase
MFAKRNKLTAILAGLLAALAAAFAPAQVVFEGYSAYHHIRVVDRGGLRVLQFNDSEETRMSLHNPLHGHFEYTEYFHMPWLWNTNIQRVLMLGLGGGSIQRAYLHHYPNVTLDTAELDPAVIAVAAKYFGITEAPRHKIHSSDGRVFLRRHSAVYDVIIVDAYTTTRYGPSLPSHLTTREFFTLAGARLGTNGVLAYNVIGRMSGGQAGLVGSLHRTMQTVFPRVYPFPASESQNVVLVATKTDLALTYAQAQRLGAERVRLGAARFPNFTLRLRNLVSDAPPGFAKCLVLTDDYAPVESLMQATR